MRNERERFFPFFFFFLNGDEDEKRTRKESLAKLHLFSFVLWEGGFYRGNKEWFRTDKDIEKSKGFLRKLI